MPTLTPDRWKFLSPRLDVALEMSQTERTAWLTSLRRENPTLVAELEILLEERRSIVDEGFLERGTVRLPEEQGLAGQTLGPYTLISQIGQGGMGSVWLAERSDGRF